MNSQDLEALKALAEKATPGEWERRDTPDYAEIHSPLQVPAHSPLALVGRVSDADFVSRFNPQTALALLAHITALEAAAAELKAFHDKHAPLVATYDFEGAKKWREQIVVPMIAEARRKALDEAAGVAQAAAFPEASKCLPTPRRGFELAQRNIAATILALKERP